MRAAIAYVELHHPERVPSAEPLAGYSNIRP